MNVRWALLRTTSVVAVLVGLLAGVPVAGAEDAIDPKLKSAIEDIVRDYLKAHPEAIEESLKVLEARREAEARDKAREAVAAHQDELFGDPESPIHGNPSGDVTLVEFFDYRCRYCKAVAPAVAQLLKEDPNVRLVYKDFPILGDASVVASKAALASRAQGKYAVFHEALMAVSGDLTAAAVIETAAKVGLDTAKLQTDMEAPAIMAVIEKNRSLAHTLGLTGTPAFVVGKELLPGAIDFDTMKELVAQARVK